MPPTDRLRRRALRWTLLVGALAGLVLVVLAVVRLATVAQVLREAEAEIDAAADLIKDGRIRDARQSLRSARTSIDEANADLRTSPSLALIGSVPVVSHNLRAIEDSVEVAAVMVHGGLRILDAANDLESADGTLQVSLSAGTVDVEDVDRARVEIAALRAALPDRVPEPSRLLVSSTEAIYEKVFGEVVARGAELDRLDHGLTLLSELVGAERPRRYLLAVANSAEMRGTGGMILNYGVLEGAEGTVELTEFGRVEELEVAVPVEPASVELPSDYLARWDGFDVTGEWRNATMSGDLPLVAPTMEAMYRRSTGLPTDGVIQVDPAGLAAILEAVGPVTVPELGEVSSSNVEALVLNEAYLRFPGVQERTDVLGDVAEAAFRRLVDGDYPSVRDLAGVIGDAVEGRHLLVHSRDADVQRAVERFGATGALPDADEVDYLHLTVQNLSGNKLDYYLDTALEVRGTRPAGEVGELEVAIRITNGAPVDVVDPRYIFGPFDDDFVSGGYRGVATLYLPTGSSLEGVSGGPFRLEPSLQTEDGRPLVGFIFDIGPGDAIEAVLRLRMPPRGDGQPLIVVPQPRARPTTATIDVDVGNAALAGEVTLDRAWRLLPGQVAAAIVATEGAFGLSSP